MKVNKTHGGKEFRSFFRFIGQVKKNISGMGDDAKTNPIFEEKTTKTGKQRRSVVFDVCTTKHNKIAVRLDGMERETAYIYSSTDKGGRTIKWVDRANKDKYPNKTYHLIAEPWDVTKEISEQINEGDWVEVKGKYEFDTFTNDKDETFPVIKRMISSVEPVEDGQEIKLGEETFNYVCDYDSPDFREVNLFDLEIGIASTYQDEETKNTKVNGIFLDYGKEASVPKPVELIVFYKDAGKKTLADAFAQLDRLDFIRVTGVDNNRPEFALVDDVEIEEDDIFADVDEQVTVKSWAISGNKKGLEITNVVKGSRKAGILTEEEIMGQVVEKEEIADEEMPAWLKE